jgi:hypothetical protein
VDSSHKSAKNTVTSTELYFSLGNCQIDNLQSEKLPVIFGACKLYEPFLKSSDDPVEKAYLKIEE